MKVLVTGATGFVGSNLIPILEINNHTVVGTSRRTSENEPAIINIGNLSDNTDWSVVLQGCEAVVHTAGRAHILNDQAKNKLAEFRRINRDATLKLARDAHVAGVKHFIFISSIGVNGNATHGIPFSEGSTPQPTSDYAISKLEAEQALMAEFANSDMAITVIRPALICGENAPGNIRRLLKIVATGLPLPFKNIKNKRGMASLSNVISFITTCVENPRSKNELFLLADEIAPSTEEIIRSFARGMKKPARIIWFPTFLLGVFLKLAGRKNLYEQLYGSLEIDVRKSMTLLNWKPPVSILETMEKTAEHFSKEIK